jgi:hypothetical protein
MGVMLFRVDENGFPPHPVRMLLQSFGQNAWHSTLTVCNTFEEGMEIHEHVPEGALDQCSSPVHVSVGPEHPRTGIMGAWLEKRHF